VFSAVQNAREKQRKSAELAARLKLSEEHNRQLREENQKLKGLAEENERLKAQNSHYCERTALLDEEVRWLKALVFGRTNDKLASDTSADQQLLFNEAKVLAAIEAADVAYARRITKIAVHEREHTGGRKAIPKNFPGIIIPHGLPESEQYCPDRADHPALKCIGMAISERHRYKQPKILVEQYQRLKFACECCHNGVKIAPNPPQLLPKTMASGSLLAHLITAKFVDGQPLYRISRQLQRSGIDLSPGTAGTWVNLIGGEKIVPLINLMNETLLQAAFLHVDETYLKVLKSDKAVDSTHYMVARAGEPPGQRIILYNYEPSRTADALKGLLIGPDRPYTGRLLTDGLELYDHVSESLKLLHFGCLQHCRAYYIKAKKVSELPSSRRLAQAAIEDYFRKVSAVEEEITTRREEYANRGETLPLETVLQQVTRTNLRRSWGCSSSGWMNCCLVCRRRARSATRWRIRHRNRRKSVASANIRTCRSTTTIVSSRLKLCDREKSLGVLRQQGRRHRQRESLLASHDRPRQGRGALRLSQLRVRTVADSHHSRGARRAAAVKRQGIAEAAGAGGRPTIPN